MRERIAVLLVLCVLVNTTASARTLPNFFAAESFCSVLEQQPLVKCLSVFSDISLQVVNQWFLHNQMQSKGTPRPQQKDRHSPLSKDGIFISVDTGKLVKAFRALAAHGAIAVRRAFPVIADPILVLRSTGHRPSGPPVLLLLLMLLTLLPRADLGDGIVVRARISPTPRSRDRAFSFVYYPGVMLSNAKHLVVDGKGEILRFTQDDTWRVCPNGGLPCTD